MGSFVRDAQQKVTGEAVKQPGMSIQWGGESPNQQSAMQRPKTVAGRPAADARAAVQRLRLCSGSTRC